MPTYQARSSAWRDWVAGGLVLAAFLAPGAWRITYMPAQPVAAASQLFVAAVWALAVALGLVGVTRVDRRVLWGLGGLAAAILVTWVAGGWVFQSAVYDIYAEMPLTQWLAFPLVFVLAASIGYDRSWVVPALSACTALATVMSIAVAYQASTLGGMTYVFGTTAYSITALAPFIVVAAALAAQGEGVSRWLHAAAAAVIAVCLGVFSGAVMGAVAVVFAILIATAIQPFSWRGRQPALGIALGALVGLGIVLLLLAQLPAASGSVVALDSGAVNESIASRIYMWRGAQEMFLDSPLVGHGPSGYRLNAVRYLESEALAFGPDVPGTTDPTLFSPQSPHSLLWEVATRMGILGILGLVGLLVCWALVLRDRVRDGGPDTVMRAGLAGAFVVVLVSLMVNPVLYPIGLFAPVAAALAVAVPNSQRVNGAGPVGWQRVMAGIAGIALAFAASWVLYGQWVAESVSPDDPAAALAAHERASQITPGNPMFERRMFVFRLALATDAAAIAQVQREIDAAPGYITGFAPNMVYFASYSLNQAESTGRTDVSWERRVLDEASAEIAPNPALVAERLHVALLEGDRAAIAEAVVPAQQWGRSYPFTEQYLGRASEALSAP